MKKNQESCGAMAKLLEVPGSLTTITFAIKDALKKCDKKPDEVV